MKSIQLDEDTMSLLEYLAWVSNSKKATLLRKIVQIIGNFGMNFKKPCEINFRHEGNRIVIEFCGFSRTEFGKEDVSKGESKQVKDVLLHVKGKLKVNQNEK